MEYELKKPLQVYVKTEESGQYEPFTKVEVLFVGKKGLQAIKRLQDVIFKIFSEQRSDAPKNKDNKRSNAPVNVDEVLDILEMTGASERLFDAVMGAMKAFANVGDTKLSDTYQEQMEAEDLDGLYQEVLKHFLLPKITRKMNNMNN